MFDNYGQYAKDILAAAKSMTPKAEVNIKKMAAGGAAAVLACGLSIAGGSAAFAHAEVQSAIESVSAEITEKPVEVVVDDPSDTSVAALLSDSPNNLSAKDEAAISEQIKCSITPEAIAAASGSFNSEGLLEIEIKTSDDIPVTVQVKKNDDGSYSVEKVIAKLDAAQAETKKQEVSSSITSDDQKKAHAQELTDFDDAFDTVTGISENATDEERASAYDAQMLVLADNLVMALPSGYTQQESDAEIPDDPIPMTSGTGADVPEEKLKADSVEPYAWSYKGGEGSLLSIRSENLGAAFTSMNGLDGVNKMKGYWTETATSISEGASQTLKNEENGFSTEVFYDAESGMWGYFGHVEFTDGTRDVVYNRVVFVDELADQLITVSYRHDCAADAGSAMSLEDFKKCIMHAPVAGTSVGEGVVDGDAGAGDVEVAEGILGGGVLASGDGADDKVGDKKEQKKSHELAVKAYNDKLYQIQILPGQDMTEPKRIAAEETAKADEAEAAAIKEEAAGEENGE